MDDFITEEELLQLERWCQEEEETEIDPDMEVWLSNDFCADDDLESQMPASAEIIRQAVSNELRGVKKFELNNTARKDMVDKLLVLFDGKVLPRGAIKNIASQFNVHRTTVWRIWSRAVKQIRRAEVINVNSKKKGVVGRKPKEWDLDILNAVPVEKRTTLRALAHALGIGFSTVYGLIKSGKLRAHSNSIKPTVSAKNKVLRLRYVLSQVIIPQTVCEKPKFSAMYNVVHIDEKWFYLSQKTQKFYLFPWEDEPYRTCQSKNFIPKVMFLCAVARPAIESDGSIIWDGKIGMFAFTMVEYAKKSSKNRERGTPETKAVQSITKEVIRSKLIQDVLPAIMSKWPSHYTKDIWIVQDNARPHIGVDDEDFKRAANVDGFNIRLTCQPAQSPDLNVLDLGFFRSIQSLQYKKFPKNVDELVASVENAFQAFDPMGLNYTWLQLQYCMLEVMGAKGGNNYKNPHNGKLKMDRMGMLPIQVEVPRELIIESRSHLEEGQMLATTTGPVAPACSGLPLPQQ